MGRDRSARIQMVVGALLIVVTAIGGLYVAFRPGSTPVDRAFADAFGDRAVATFHRVPLVRNPLAMGVGAVLLSAIEVYRDRVRALAVLVGPLVALSTSESVVKPLVGRHLGPALSYPSGTVVATTALATALVLVTPERWRGASVVVATLYTGWTCVAVVALDWHYATDAAAGVTYGAGVVLVVDGLAWALLGHRRLPAFRRRPATGPAALAPDGPRPDPSVDG